MFNMKDRLETYLLEQLDFLELSCKSFDNGYLHEAKRLATTLRVILHDTNQSHSLLGQLGIKSKIGFYDTCLDFNPKNMLSHNGILRVHLSGRDAVYEAPLDDNPLGMNHSKPFEDWWNKLVFASLDDKGFTRKKIVTDLANKEGGAHVDPKLNSKFQKLTNGEYLNTQFIIEEDSSYIENAPAFAMRQIAFEVIHSLQDRLEPNNKPTTLEYLIKSKSEWNIKKVCRNDICPCGSGIKYKKCCLNKNT